MDAGGLVVGAQTRHVPAPLVSAGAVDTGPGRRRLLPSSSPRSLPSSPRRTPRMPSPRGGGSPLSGKASPAATAELPAPRSHPFGVEHAGRYKSLRLLGRGSFGTVTLVKDVRDGRLFALKRIRSTSDSSMKHTRDEIEIMQRIEHHPNVVHLVDVFMSAGAAEVCLLMTYCDSGDLAQLLSAKHRERGRVSEPQALSWAAQIAFALDHLRRHQLVHRDLKPENVMLSDHQTVARIADFGLAVHVADPDASLRAEVGTPLYTSPEIFGNEQYDYSTDMWSFGVVLYETLALEVPFRGDTNQQLAVALLEGTPADLPSCYSFAMHDLVASMLRRDPAQRPTPRQLLVAPIMRVHVDRFMGNYGPAHVDMRTRRAHIRSLKTQLQAAVAGRAGGDVSDAAAGGEAAEAVWAKLVVWEARADMHSAVHSRGSPCPTRTRCRPTPRRRPGRGHCAGRRRR